MFKCCIGVGAAGGGALIITGHFLQLDGEISVDGETPHDTIQANAGKLVCISFFRK